MKIALLATLALILPTFADDLAPLKSALEKQAQHRSVIVDFRQKKKSPALTSEIITPGKLTLIPRKAFRWELGQPTEQIVIYNGQTVFILDEKEKTAEKLSPDDPAVKPLFLTLGFGEDASYDGLTRLFKITSTNQAQGRYAATMIPTDRKLKRGVKSLLMQLNLQTSFPERLGWTQRDDTEVMIEFLRPTLNAPVPASTFQFTESQYRWKK